MAVLNLIGLSEGQKPPLDEGNSPPIGKQRFDHRFEATGNRRAQQLPSRAEVVVDVAGIDPGTVGDLAEIETGQYAVATEQVEGGINESTLGFGSIFLFLLICLRAHRSPCLLPPGLQGDRWLVMLVSE